MNNKEFKTVFAQTAKSYGFKSAFGNWYKESSECIAILELQKSNFADCYYLNIKTFIQGLFELKYAPSKEVVKSSMGHITNQIRDLDVFNLDKSMDDTIRNEQLNKYFENYIVPYTNKILSKYVIKEMAKKGEITLLPAVKVQLSYNN
ncbi:MAG: DUF4304 domain-containing protein [Bacteroidota bacterium]